MSVKKKKTFTFKRFAHYYEETGFQGFSQDEICSSLITNQSKVEVIKDKISEIDPSFVCSNVNKADFEGFQVEDVEMGTEVNDQFNDVFHNFLLVNNLNINSNSNFEDIVEPRIVEEELFQEVQLQPKDEINVSSTIQPKTHVFIKNGSRRGQDIIIDSDGYTYTRKSRPNNSNNPSPQIYTCSKRSKNFYCKARILPCRKLPDGSFQDLYKGDHDHEAVYASFDVAEFICELKRESLVDEIITSLLV